MELPRIIIAEDQDTIRRVLSHFLEDEGYLIKAVSDGEQAIEMAASFRPQVVLMDKNMPRMDGIRALAKIKAALPEAVVIIMTAYGDVASAVEAMKLGAYDYIEKPFDNNNLLLLIRRALAYHSVQPQKENLRATDTVKSLPEGVSIIGRSPVVQRLLAETERISQTQANVLITGESGTGKELIAQMIHTIGKRNGKPFVAVNCGAIPTALFESEFFGHEQGAFTDAKKQKRGKFEQANGGTLFLDEIGELTPESQVKLLRVLEERKLTRLGGDKTVDLDVRIVSATNQDLDRMIEENRFRLDLFYRLNLFTIHVPSLQERKEDIPLLVDFFIRKYNDSAGNPITRCSEDALRLLMAYDWPGNVRDLQNAVQSSMIMAEKGEIEPGHLPIRITNAPRGTRLSSAEYASESTGAEENKEIDAILTTLKNNKYNRQITAEILGISRKTLYNKIKKYGLE